MSRDSLTTVVPNSKPGEDPSFSPIPRIDRLLQHVVAELRAFTEEQAQQITDLVDIGKAMSAEHDPASMLEMILSQARKFTKADGGTLYMLTEDKQELAFHVLHNDTLNSYMGGLSGNEITLPNVALYHIDGNQNRANVCSYVAHTLQTVNIADVYETKGFNFEGTKTFDTMMNYRSMSMLVLPMRNHENELIGVLQLINAKDPDTNKTIPFRPESVDMAEALASQAAVILTQQQLISGLKHLFESFIQAIAMAIEAKSKYTGGHIGRVTELTMMIADALNAATEGPFADVGFSRTQMDELRIASWLHDTGKITTPQHVVDKANKLETVFDRIELVKTRWRAVRLSRLLNAERRKVLLLQKQLEPGRLQAIDSACQAELEHLNDDLAFLETINMGGEFMADDKLERLNEIAARRYRDDTGEYPVLEEDEVLNLSIRKGTLNAEERELMNDHVVMSKNILDSLPWPQNMKDVPAIAAAHHEKLDGSGYPLGLKGDEISLQSRIMAVADIFEALSAKDRPYKEPMPLSQAMKILGFMIKDNHLDKDVVDLFLNSGILREYARKHLNEEQIDV